jgi:hypothetical protein
MFHDKLITVFIIWRGLTRQDFPVLPMGDMHFLLVPYEAASLRREPSFKQPSFLAIARSIQKVLRLLTCNKDIAKVK